MVGTPPALRSGGLAHPTDRLSSMNPNLLRRVAVIWVVAAAAA
jgi:hypothetical protein